MLLNDHICFVPDDLSAGSLPLVNISASVSLSAADMTLYLKKMSRGEAVEGNRRTNSNFTFKSWIKMSKSYLPRSASDVLEVLTEVDEKSRRSPEIIQYFTVSQKQQKQRVKQSTCRLFLHESPPCVTVCRIICRDSWLPLKSCVGTWPSVWLCAASRIIPGRFTGLWDKPAPGKVLLKSIWQWITPKAVCFSYFYFSSLMFHSVIQCVFSAAAWQQTSCQHSCTVWAVVTLMWYRLLSGTFQNMCFSVKVRTYAWS